MDFSSLGSSGKLTMNGALTCDVLLAITASSIDIPKRNGVVWSRAGNGYIRNCTGALAGSPNTGAILGMSFQYTSFSGALPNITRVQFAAPDGTFVFRTIAGDCLYGGPISGLGIDMSGGSATGIDFDSTSSIPRVSGSILCPSTATLRGDLTTFLPSPPRYTLI